MYAFKLLPLLAALVLAENQGQGCNPDKYTMGCSGQNIVKCYTWEGRSKPTWNFVQSCSDSNQKCCNGICTSNKCN
nr:uncharacterized protein CTRU02_02002 [Colletotrichum truncatum]KAF6799131.1 hypothetical protein CTRU02_02002 [Colletotrichum truncatum]